MLYLFCSTIYTFLLGEQDSTFRKKSFRAAGPLVFGFSCQQEYFSAKGEKLVKKKFGLGASLGQYTCFVLQQNTTVTRGKWV